jgi:zinc finger SWIM domain-containing protein 3
MNEKPTNEQENIDPNVNQRDDFLSAATLKKQEVQLKNSKRKKTWIDKLRPKGKCKQAKSAKAKKKVTKVRCKLATYIMYACCSHSSQN